MNSLATMAIARKVPRQERSRALVEAILEAAARILVQQGRDALTTNAVAMRAGASIGSLYQYFPNRESILTAVAQKHLLEVYHSVAAAALSDACSLEDATTRIVAALFAAHCIDPALHLALAAELGAAPKETGARNQPDAKVAVIGLFLNLSPSIRSEIRSPDYTVAISVAAEMAHSLAHLAIQKMRDDATDGRLEGEAVRAILAYLRSS